ncbi:MAG: cupredoxin domain-containing protein, partial [Thermomicrobiales bacterium]
PEGQSGMDVGMATTTPTATPAAVIGPTAAIIVVDDRFTPNALTVAVGTTVVWTNNGQDWHDIASFDGSFASGRFSPGETFAHVFDHGGIYKYICKHHFMQGMTGAIVVN